MKILKNDSEWRKALTAILILVALWMITSCAPDKITDGLQIETIEHEGCEYVLARGYKKLSITHAGNCSNHTEQPCKEIRYR